MDESIQTFMAITDTDDQTAKQYLEFANQDVELAISLYIESGGNNNAHNNASTADTPVASNDDDAEYAQRLQSELYQQSSEPRAPDQARHETLMDTFGFGGGNAYPQVPRPADIYGGGPRGIFNQRFEILDEYGDDDDEDEEMLFVEDEDDDDDYAMELNSDGEVVERERIARRRPNVSSRSSGMSSRQRRLAQLFRPPFDIMELLDLDSARKKGREEKKWILINIQDSSEFQCQVLNRDFWSSDLVKNVIQENFIFLQYQHDSSNGSNYVQFYQVDSFPHIAILDPMTGEKLKAWSDIPTIKSWIEEVTDFLSKFSLLPGHINPIVQHEVKIDPDRLTEEQQIELALRQSLGVSNSGTGTSQNPISLESDIEDEQAVGEKEEEEEEEEKELTEEDIFNNIAPKEHEEPTDNLNSTRIQIRFSDGKRLIHKFKLDEQVITIFEFLKYHIKANEIESKNFSLTSQRLNLLTVLEKTVQDAGLRNASILCEFS